MGIVSEPLMNAYSPPQEVEDASVYRSVSRAAVASVVMAVAGMLGLLFPSLLVFAGAGIVLSLVALRTISRFPQEFSGHGTAMFGCVASVVILAGGGAIHAYEYATECPEDAIRISFVNLNPEDRNAPEIPPTAAVALNGKKVFIKGYVYPDGQGANIKQFVLIPDLGTCCFGGQPRLTDMVLVTLQEPHRTVYNQRKRNLTGVLKVDPTLRPVQKVTGVFYELDAEWIK
jgi:hypothetical protein